MRESTSLNLPHACLLDANQFVFKSSDTVWQNGGRWILDGAAPLHLKMSFVSSVHANMDRTEINWSVSSCSQGHNRVQFPHVVSGSARTISSCIEVSGEKAWDHNVVWICCNNVTKAHVRWYYFMYLFFLAWRTAMWVNLKLKALKVVWKLAFLFACNFTVQISRLLNSSE